MRPFQIGDRATYQWGSKTTFTGTVYGILQSPSKHGLNRVYAALRFDNGSVNAYPVDQLKPAGWTRFSFHHLLYNAMVGCNNSLKKVFW